MSDILIAALANRIKVGQMILDQVPEVYREKVEELLKERV